MAETSRSSQLSACPYCGQPIGRAEQQRIAAQEEARMARIAAEMEVAQQAKLRGLEAAKQKAEQESSKLAAQLKDVPQQIEARLAQERAQIAARVEAAQQAKLQALEEGKRKAEQEANLKEQQLQRSEKAAEDLKRQLQQSRAAHEVGTLAEDELEQELRKRFPTDEITRVSKGRSGADVSHQVRDKGLDCGTILYECKDTRTWQNSYVSKLVDDKTAYGASYAILVSAALPRTYFKSSELVLN